MTTDAPEAPEPRRPRRARGAQESLASIVLGFESVIAFLGGLVIFGLRAVPAGIEPWWGIVAGTVIAVLMVACAAVVRHRWGVVAGWMLQLAVLAAGFLNPAFFVVAAIFGGLWAYANIKGAALDRQNARLRAEREKNGD